MDRFFFIYNLRNNLIYIVTTKNKSNVKSDPNQLQFKLDIVKLIVLTKEDHISKYRLCNRGISKCNESLSDTPGIYISLHKSASQ